MPSKPQVRVQTTNTQRDSRWLVTVYDQHKSPRFQRGRPFYGYVELPAERRADPSFVQEFMPGDHEDPLGSVWSAPWLPDQLTQSDGTGNRSYYRLDMKTFRLTWNYAGIIADDTRVMEAYYEVAARMCYEKGWTAPDFGAPIPYQLRAAIGPPTRSPKIAQAALAGDPWILGHSETVNVDLQQLLKGIRPDSLSASVLRSADVLAPQANIEEIVKAAVAAALAAEREQNRARGARMRAGKAKKGKKGKPSDATAAA